MGRRGLKTNSAGCHLELLYLTNAKMISIESTGERNASYDDFLEALQKGGVGECRYGLYDFEYSHQCQGTSGSQKAKLILISWCPDNASIKKKMLYASSLEALKKALVGVHKYIQATDLSEASIAAVEEKCRGTDRN